MKDGVMRIAMQKTKWWDFDLYRGHIYGLFEGVCYVSACEPDTRPGFIIVYEQRPDRANAKRYVWEKKSIPADCDLAGLIFDAMESSPFKGVEFKEPHFDLHSEWKGVGSYRQAPRKESTELNPFIINWKKAGVKKPDEWERRKAELRQHKPEPRQTADCCHYDDRAWKPHYPTFREKRAEYKPVPPAPKPQTTWSDEIVVEELARREGVRAYTCVTPHLWRGFWLEKGCIYGVDSKGLFVSAAKPGRRPGTIVVHRKENDGEWYDTVTFTSQGTGKIIVARARL